MTSDEIKDYTLRISQANAGALALITCELAIDAIDNAKKALSVDEKNAFVLNAKKAERYVGELIHSLDMQDKMANVMAGYLIAAHKSIVDARLKFNEGSIMRAEAIMMSVKPTFDRIANEDNDPSIMNNVEQVYAGLTYGKMGLNEMAVGVSSNRGYSV